MGVQLIKAIKPRPLEVAEVQTALMNAMRKEGELSAKTLEQTTRSWQGAKPSFVATVAIEGNNAVLRIGPVGDGSDKWVFIDKGTRPHPILPRRAKRLRFFIGGKAGSSPGTFITKAATKGTKQVFSKGVLHPGIKARNWSETLTTNRFPLFYSAMEAAVYDGIQKSTRR